MDKARRIIVAVALFLSFGASDLLAAISVSVGTYVGNGSVRSITGAGFTPKVILIYSDCTSATGNAAGSVFKTADMGTYSYLWGDNDKSLGISSIDADGFSLTTADFANKTGSNYYWAAFSGDDVKTGTYIGNATDNRNITGVGFQPEWVWLQTTANSHSMQKMNSTGASTDISHFGTTLDGSANIIQALQADGFQVGSTGGPGGLPNNSGETYYYAAFKDSASTYNVRYTGNGSSPRSVESFGFQPEFVFIKQTGAYQACVRSSSLSSNYSALTITNTGLINTGILSLSSDGVTVGNSTSVNTNGQTYDLFAFDIPATESASTLSGTILGEVSLSGIQVQ
jgi:hypothetical protein